MKLTGLQPGIYELNEENYTVEDGKKALWIKGNVYDSNVDYLKGKRIKHYARSKRSDVL